MTVVAVDVFEADVFEDGVFADFTSDFIDRMDLTQKFIFIKTDVIEFLPVADIYPEVRGIRRIDESLRGTDMPMTAQGNEQAGAGFTPRRAVLNNGWRIALQNTVNGQLEITGELISDDGGAGSQLINVDNLGFGVSMLVNYAPPDAEIIVVGGAGLTAQAIWEYATRTLTGNVATDNAAIATAVESQLADEFAAIPSAAAIATAVDSELATEFAAIPVNVESQLVDEFGALPTAAEIRTEIDTNSTQLAAILADTGTDLPALLATLDTVVDAIKVKTDQLTFTKANEVDANIKSTNDATTYGTGVEGDEWRGTPTP